MEHEIIEISHEPNTPSKQHNINELTSQSRSDGYRSHPMRFKIRGRPAMRFVHTNFKALQTIPVSIEPKSTSDTHRTYSALLLEMAARRLGVCEFGWVMMMGQSGIVSTLETKDCVFVIVMFFLVCFRYWSDFCPQATGSLTEASRSLLANSMQQLSFPVGFNINKLFYWCKLFSAIICAVLSLFGLISHDFRRTEVANKANRNIILIVFYILAVTETVLLLLAPVIERLFEWAKEEKKDTKKDEEKGKIIYQYGILAPQGPFEGAPYQNNGLQNRPIRTGIECKSESAVGELLFERAKEEKKEQKKEEKKDEKKEQKIGEKKEEKKDEKKEQKIGEKKEEKKDEKKEEKKEEKKDNRKKVEMTGEEVLFSIGKLLDTLAHSLAKLVCWWAAVVLVQSAFISTLEAKDHVFITVIFLLDVANVSINVIKRFERRILFFSRLIYWFHIVSAMTCAVLSIMRLASHDFSQNEVANKVTRDFALQAFYAFTAVLQALVLLIFALAFESERRRLRASERRIKTMVHRPGTESLFERAKEAKKEQKKDEKIAEMKHETMVCKMVQFEPESADGELILDRVTPRTIFQRKPRLNRVSSA